MNQSEAIELMQSHGLIVSSLTFGKIIKTATQGKPSKRNGWYFINEHNGEVSGVFGNYDEYGDQKIAIRGKVNATQRTAQKQQREAEVTDGLKEALRAWNLSDPISNHQHEYAEKKKLKYNILIRNGVKIDRYGNLVFNLKNNGKFAGIQRIAPDGTKRFNKGFKMAGSYYEIEDVGGADIAYCEGIATGFTIANIFRFRKIICCLSACNIESVAKQFGLGYLFADNDLDNKVNTGRESAIKNADLFSNIFTPKEHGDINDMYVEHGMYFDLERIK